MLARHGAAIPPMRAHHRRCGRQPGARPRGAAGFADDLRTHVVTPGELARSLDDLAAALPQLLGRLDELVLQAGKATDLASALASERGDDASADMLYGSKPHNGRSTAGVAIWRRTTSRPRRSSAGCDHRIHGRAMANAMEFDFCSTRSSAAVDRLCRCRRRPRRELHDLVASEARLASFMAIAAGEVPARHWFRLGREVTPIGRGAALISWSGSMFEYLKPSLSLRRHRPA